MRVSWEWLAVGLLTGLAWTTTEAPLRERQVAALGGVVVACAILDDRRRGLGIAAVGALAGGLLGTAVVTVPTDPTHIVGLASRGRHRVEGRVRTVREAGVARVLVVEVDAVLAERGCAPATGRLQVRLRPSVDAPVVGDLVRLEAVLRRPRNFENPGRYDRTLALARQGIHVTATVAASHQLQILWRSRPDDQPWLIRWRGAVRRAIDAAAGGDEGAVLRALVLGDDDAVSRTLRSAFTRAGVAHVLSVSGLHVALAGGAIGAAVAWVLRRSERMALRVDVPVVAALLAVPPAIAYGALAGFEVATLRAVTMLAIAALALAAGRRVPPGRTVTLAAIASAAWLPGQVVSASFQLSFASVLILGCCVPRTGTAASWRVRSQTALVVSLAAAVGTAPLTAFHFHQVSLVGGLANPVIIPLFGSAVLLPGLAGAALADAAPGLAEACFHLAALAVSPGIVAVRWLGALPWAAVETPLPSVSDLVGAYAVLLGLVLPRGAVGRVGLLVVGASLALVGSTPQDGGPGRLRVTFLDVGQGDAAVVELADGRVLVVDGGGFPGSDFDTGAAIVEPFVRTRRIARVDAVVMTHPHPDHAGGLPHVVRALRPGEVWWSGIGRREASWRAVRRAARVVGARVRRLRRGDAIPGYETVDVVHPPRRWTLRSLNEGSLVLRIRHGDTAIFLAGDAEGAAEAAMVAHGGTLAADALKVAHHGSATSSGWVFVRAVMPALAVASFDPENRYGHPAAAVVERFDRLGVELLTTARCGAVTVESDGRRLWASGHRVRCGPRGEVRRRERR